MQSEVQKEIALTTMTELITPSLSKKEFRLRVARIKQSKYVLQIDKRVPTNKDPRLYSLGEMRRDTVRRQLGFQSLRVDVLTNYLRGRAEKGLSVRVQRQPIYDTKNLD